MQGFTVVQWPKVYDNLFSFSRKSLSFQIPKVRSADIVCSRQLDTSRIQETACSVRFDLVASQADSSINGSVIVLHGVPSRKHQFWSETFTFLRIPLSDQTFEWFLIRRPNTENGAKWTKCFKKAKHTTKAEQINDTSRKHPLRPFLSTGSRRELSNATIESSVDPSWTPSRCVQSPETCPGLSRVSFLNSNISELCAEV